MEEIVHGVLESDEDESLSEFIESESEIGDFEDEDGNELFVPATNVRLSSFPDPVDQAVVFQDEEDILDLHVHGNLVSIFSKELIWNCSIQFT